MTIKKLRPSFTFTEERLAKLRAVVPEAFADGRVNWEALREALGEWAETEGEGAEHFGLFWPGKREARRLAAKPSRGTLVPVDGEGVNEETTRNIFIEGDNLEVLKILQKSYAERVKLIYIDPPYNTGNDFVYNDDFRDPLGDYLRKSGQADSDGEALTTNTRADGRFHSNWLSMMYPRLRLARTLLRNDGVIAVSIDDTELTNLVSIMNEIFGEENRLAIVAWQSLDTIKNDARHFSRNHEYVIAYCRSLADFHMRGVMKGEKQKATYKNPDSDPRGDYLLTPLHAKSGTEQSRYTIRLSNGQDWSPPPGTYPRFAQDTLKRLDAEGRLLLDPDRRKTPQRKTYWAEVSPRMPLWTFWRYEDFGSTRQSNAELKTLLPEGVFQNPKPTKMLKALIDSFAYDDGDVVMDFFGGSGTTAHALLELNVAEKATRQFVLVQLPEPVPPESSAAANGFTTVASITKQRLRSVIAKLSVEVERDANVDLGFRVFALDESHFRAWESFDGDDVHRLETLFEEAVTPLAKGWTTDALLAEVLLLQGYPLDADVKQLVALTKNVVHLVTSRHVGHRLLICLDAKLHHETVAGLHVTAEDVLVCLDSALADEAKLRLADRCSLETI